MRAVLVLAVGIVLLVAGAAPRVTAAVERPRYAQGDFWTYRTNLTEIFGLRFEGNTTVVAGPVITVEALEGPVEALELLLTGEGTVSGTLEGTGSVAGTWTIDGTEYWETSGWKAVRSFVRLSARGEILGGSPLAFTFSLTNDTRRTILEDTWTYPVLEGAAGHVTARWRAATNATWSVSGFPPQTESSVVEGVFDTTFAHLERSRVTVPAGAFDVEAVRETPPEGGHVLRWVSGPVGNDVLQEGFNETGVRVSTAELVAFRYDAGSPPEPFPWLPVAVAVLAVTVVGLLALLSFRRRPPVDAWIPEEPEERESP